MRLETSRESRSKAGSDLDEPEDIPKQHHDEKKGRDRGEEKAHEVGSPFAVAIANPVPSHETRDQKEDEINEEIRGPRRIDHAKIVAARSPGDNLQRTADTALRPGTPKRGRRILASRLLKKGASMIDLVLRPCSA